jgi:polyphosphate glucokinase
MTPDKMVRRTLELVSDWDYSVISIGYPGPVLCGRPICEPYNLGTGWVGFDFAAAFHRPIRVVNDAAMQALGRPQSEPLATAHSSRDEDSPLAIPVGLVMCQRRAP